MEAAMPDSQQQSYLAMWMMLFLAGGALYANREQPFELLRPVGSVVQREVARADPQDIDARLWEDPFTAVHRQRAAASGNFGPGTVKASNLAGDRLIDLREWIAEEATKKTRLRTIAVPVSAEGYAEDIETRRRYRYAVAAGLKAQGYLPTDSAHVGYYVHDASVTTQWLACRSAKRALHAIIPFERYRRKSGEPLLVLWIPEDVVLDGDRPLCSLAAVIAELENGPPRKPSSPEMVV
jgi:hypothetical protein